MRPILVIVESPNKSKKIDEMFAGRFKAMATVGHICDLPASPTEGIGIDREAMKGQYELTSDKTRHTDGKRVVAKIKDYLKNNPGTEVYLATDADREGESIAAFAMKYLKLPANTKRMRFNAITRDKIDDAYRAADQVDWHAVSSREARRLIDRIIGYTISPYLQNKVGSRKGVAAGRVQTAVEALVIERERKIRNHQARIHYSVQCDLGGWQALWRVSETAPKRTGLKTNSEFDIDDVSAKCFDIDVANRAAAHRTLKVLTCEESVESRPPPSPLYTISMCQLANRILGWDADLTMQVAQKLFEGDGAGHGHITYHRTDSPNLEPAAAEEIREWLSANGYAVPEVPNTWSNKNKQAQEGHEAIRPSYPAVEIAGATDDQRALYTLIRERALYSQLCPAQYALKKIVLLDGTTATDTYTASARVLTDPGWLSTKVASSKAMTIVDETESDASTVKLPNLSPGSLVTVKSAKVSQHSTKAPGRYTMDTLMSKLEKLSIGRPATIATLLKNVRVKGTIEQLRNGQLAATQIGEKCYDVLYPRFAFAHIGYTAELERALDQIADGQMDGQALARNVWDRLDADCAAPAA